MDLSVSVRHTRVESPDGTALHVAVAGDGAPVVLLHGFPEGWCSWDLQAAALVDAGLSAWMPDLRGYGGSDRPPSRQAYALRHLVADAASVVRASGAVRAHVVGHDWGGVIAWALAAHEPELVDRLVILNAPHPRLYARELRRRPQLLRSWYAAFFQLPWVPERVLSAWDFAAVRRMFRLTSSRAAAFTGADIEARIESLARPGALRAALNYYRANRRALARSQPLRVQAETLVIWGERDPALSIRLLDGLEAVAPRARVYRLADAGHWVQRDAPDVVNRLIVEFLRGERVSRSPE